MNPLLKSLYAAAIVAAIVQLLCGNVYAAWFILFVGTAAAIPWSACLPGVFAQQTMVATLPVTHEDLSDQMVLLDPEDMIFTSKTASRTGTNFRVPFSISEKPTATP